MTQIQLSDAQAVILSTACAREDGAVFPVTAGLKGGAVGACPHVCKSLLKHGLIEEIPAADLNTVYRHDEERGPITLRATPLAYSTLGITDAPDTQDEDQSEPEATPQPVRRRSGTKQEALIEMLTRRGRRDHRRDRRGPRMATAHREGCHVRRPEKEARADDHLREGRRPGRVYAIRD